LFFFVGDIISGVGLDLLGYCHWPVSANTESQFLI